MRTTPRSPQLLALLLSSVALAWTAACSPAATGSHTQNMSPASQQPSGPVQLDVAVVVEQPLDVQLTLPGELNAFQSVDIVPRVGGFVKSVPVDRGSRVSAGQVLLTLDAPELVSQRAEAEARVQAAQAQVAASQAKADSERGTFERLKAASATAGVVAGNDVLVAEKTADASRSQLASAQQAVEAARQALASVRELEGYLRVSAPFAGVVTERNVHPGAVVSPGAGAPPLLRLVDARRLRLVVPVPEGYITNIAAGAAIPFTVAAYPGQTFTGRVARQAQAVDVRTRTMAIELDVENGDGRLAPGAFCQVRWPFHRSEPSLFVPSGSVAATTDRTFVVRIRDGKAEWIDVRTGTTAGALVEVFGNLAAGDSVAVRGTDELRPGTAVSPRSPRPPA